MRGWGLLNVIAFPQMSPVCPIARDKAGKPAIPRADAVGHCLGRAQTDLSGDGHRHLGIVVKGAQILGPECAYEKDIDDIRESPALKILQPWALPKGTQYYCLVCLVVRLGFSPRPGVFFALRWPPASLDHRRT